MVRSTPGVPTTPAGGERPSFLAMGGCDGMEARPVDAEISGSTIVN